MQPKKSANIFSNGLDGGSEYVTVGAGCDWALTMHSLQFLWGPTSFGVKAQWLLVRLSPAILLDGLNVALPGS